MASQYGADSTKFLQWHSSVGLFQISFSSGVPMYPESIRWVAQWYPSVHWVKQWHSSGIPVYTGPSSVHWLRVRGVRGCEVSCGEHHRHKENTIRGSVLDGAVLDPDHLLTNPVDNMIRYIYIWVVAILVYSLLWSIKFWWVYDYIVFELLELLSYFLLTYYYYIGFVSM